MKRLYLILILLIISLTSYSQLNKIVIDPGHGGSDFGCNGQFAYEKEINLAISLKLGELINKYLPETKVLYTRKTDKTLNLCDRAVATNIVNPDLFISIHCNASPNKNAKGIEVFIQDLSLTPSELAKIKNQDIDSEYEEIESFNCPKNDLSPEKMLLSAKIAVKIDKFLNSLGLISRGVKKSNFMVLRKTRSPSILIECGFLTNEDEEKFLSSKTGQLKIATSILKAIIEINEK